MGLGGNEFNSCNSPTSRFNTPSVQKNVFEASRTQTTEAATQRQRQVGALNLDDIKVCFMLFKEFLYLAKFTRIDSSSINSKCTKIC